MSSNLYAYILRMPRSDISLIKAYASGTALLELTDRLDEVERDKIVVATARLVKEVKKGPIQLLPCIFFGFESQLHSAQPRSAPSADSRY